MSGRNPSVINEDSAANDGTAQDGINHGRARPHRQNRTILNQNINEIVGFHFRRSRQPLLGLLFWRFLLATLLPTAAHINLRPSWWAFIRKDPSYLFSQALSQFITSNNRKAGRTKSLFHVQWWRTRLSFPKMLNRRSRLNPKR